MANCFWFYSMMGEWSTWQWVVLDFSQFFWYFDTPETPGSVSVVCAENEIWNRLKQFLSVWYTQDSILSEFRSFFGRIRDFIICFRDLLTFNIYLPNYCLLTCLFYLDPAISLHWSSKMDPFWHLSKGGLISESFSILQKMCQITSLNLKFWNCWTNLATQFTEALIVHCFYKCAHSEFTSCKKVSI